MSKPLELKINNFSGGIADDIRKFTVTEFQITKHFDIFSNPNRLTPYRSLESDTETAISATDLKQYLVRDFVYASTSAKLYGLGQTGAGLTKIVQKADATTGLWTTPATSEGNGAVWNGIFFEYKDYLWGLQGTNQLYKWGLLSGSPSITNSVSTVASTITSVANGVIAADGNAYFAYNNVIVRIAPGLTVTDSAKTVPTNYKITSLANYGSYLAVGCSPINSFNGQSKVFIWNLSSDLFQETIDWGEGDLRVLEVIEGLLVGVTDRYLNNATGAGRGSMIIQGYTGGSAQVLKEVFTQALVGKTIPIQKVVKNNRLFWAAKIMTNSAGTTYNEGIWSFGRKNSNYPFALTLDIIDENIDTDGIQGIGSAANYFFIAHSGDGSVDKTNDASTYAFTSVYESQIFDFGDPCLVKQLSKFTIYTAPIPTSGSVTVKYKINSDTSFTTIGTLSTVGEITRDFYLIESTAVDFPTFKEIQFRIESVTGGAEITGFKISANPLIGSSNP
tara:strand:+ start:1045 stop:2556 length:1512 start_codon:yes stop_codon:yes gene_type:complete